jgi:integrase
VVRKSSNGEGTIYLRKDGRYEAAAYLLTSSRARKRIRVYGRTRQEAHDKLLSAISQSRQGALPDEHRKIGEYLDYWLEEVIRPHRRSATYEQYEATIRLYLKPGLGSQPIDRLSVSFLQAFLNRALADGQSVRKVQLMRAVLSSALTRAMREELITRNVAQIVELPTWQRAEIQPWSVAEARHFLEIAQDDPLYPAFMLLVYFGMRRGEVLGLRWQDVDFAGGVIKVRQQLGRVGRSLLIGPVKTTAGNRDLPLLSIIRSVLLNQQQRQAGLRRAAGEAWRGGDEQAELVFTTRSGLPIEPRNLARSFHRLCEQHGIRRIKVHHVRHTAATLLMQLRIPPREAQLILGHAQLVTTQQIYQHGSLEGRQEALEQVEMLLSRDVSEGNLSSSSRGGIAEGSRQLLPSTPSSRGQMASILSGGAGGARTPDLVNVKLDQLSACKRATVVGSALNVWRKQWLLGIVAVSVAVKILI